MQSTFRALQNNIVYIGGACIGPFTKLTQPPVGALSVEKPAILKGIIWVLFIFSGIYCKTKASRFENVLLRYISLLVLFQCANFWFTKHALSPLQNSLSQLWGP